MAPAGATAPYQTTYTFSVKFDVSNGNSVTATDTFTFDVLIKNPCVSSSEVPIIFNSTPTTLSALEYYISNPTDTTFTGPQFQYTESPLCGDISVVAKYGNTTPVTIDDDDMPLAYDSPTFTVDTDDDTLIGQTVAYSLEAFLTDYAPVANTGTSGATSTTLSSSVTYKDPCPVLGSTGFSWTTFEAATGPNTLTTDLYTAANFEIDADSIFNISPDFCDDTVIYTCSSVTGPDSSGTTVTYAAGTYPGDLCTLNGENKLIVTAGPTNYLSTTTPSLSMPPGTYTFTITATTEPASGITATVRTTTVTWTLTDPCTSQVLSMVAFTLSDDSYTITEADIDDNALPAATAAPGIAQAGQDVDDFCTFTYTPTYSDNVVTNCLDVTGLSAAPFTFDIGCDETNIAAVLGTDVSDDFTITWTAVLSSPYQASISSAS